MKSKLVAIAVILLGGMAAMAQTVSIQLEQGSFKVTGWKAPAKPPSKGWPSIFSVYTGAGDVPPLLGSYSVEGGSLVFRPQFPAASGVNYRAIFRPPDGGAPVEETFAGLPKPTVASARVVGVYPTAEVLPSNELRLYIYFSAPMSRGEAAHYVHMLDETGKVLTGVFLPEEELWDPNYDRLTMTFDPGRIKRGLTSNEKMGPPIVEGTRYTLVIDRAWPDARGVPMVEGFHKSFRGGAPIRSAPDPEQWRLALPRAGTRGALVIDFPTPMNYPLLQSMLHVSSSHGSVDGKVSIDGHETRWRFIPQKPWEAGGYQLVVDAAVEDLAGNHIGQLFDMDVFHRITEHIATKTVSLPFTVSAHSAR